ncbi:MAG: hypothetical protein KGL39_00530 [Patescibacteria group bacterium]|nr:hypothetical protein [Patescibacteria group bacterium]
MNEQEKVEIAGQLEWCSQLLTGYMSTSGYLFTSQGETEDQTGLGAWMIFTPNLEAAAYVKVVPEFYYGID